MVLRLSPMCYDRKNYTILARVGPLTHMSAFEWHAATNYIGNFNYVMPYLSY